MRPTDEIVLAALVKSSSTRAAAREIGCTENLIRQRLKNPNFQARLAAEKAEILTAAVNQMRGNLSTAVSTLTEIMRDSAAPPSVRVQGADLLLRHFLKYFETSELLKRVEKLEEISRESDQ